MKQNWAELQNNSRGTKQIKDNKLPIIWQKEVAREPVPFFANADVDWFAV